jgi:hypothetical protein
VNRSAGISSNLNHPTSTRFSSLSSRRNPILILACRILQPVDQLFAQSTAPLLSIESIIGFATCNPIDSLAFALRGACPGFGSTAEFRFRNGKSGRLLHLRFRGNGSVLEKHCMTPYTCRCILILFDACIGIPIDSECKFGVSVPHVPWS